MSYSENEVYDLQRNRERLAEAKLGVGLPNVCVCGKPAVRDHKCEEHKVERRAGWGDRRRYESCDSPTSCGNGMCRTRMQDGAPATVHHTDCPDYGPGWA